MRKLYMQLVGLVLISLYTSLIIYMTHTISVTRSSYQPTYASVSWSKCTFPSCGDCPPKPLSGTNKSLVTPQYTNIYLLYNLYCKLYYKSQYVLHSTAAAPKVYHQYLMQNTKFILMNIKLYTLLNFNSIKIFYSYLLTQLIFIILLY